MDITDLAAWGEFEMLKALNTAFGLPAIVSDATDVQDQMVNILNNNFGISGGLKSLLKIMESNCTRDNSWRDAADNLFSKTCASKDDKVMNEDEFCEALSALDLASNVFAGEHAAERQFLVEAFCRAISRQQKNIDNHVDRNAFIDVYARMFIIIRAVTATSQPPR
jgi:hypothetical protein